MTPYMGTHLALRRRQEANLEPIVISDDEALVQPIVISDDEAPVPAALEVCPYCGLLGYHHEDCQYEPMEESDLEMEETLQLS